METGTASQKRKPLKDDLFRRLHEGILAGRHGPGQWLRQNDIARQFGVSMTPVREAFDLLVSCGLAERVPYRGVRVLQLSNPDILDSYEMRLLLEAAAARLAASRAAPDDSRRLHDLLAEEASAVSAADMVRQREISRALHTDIVGVAGNPLLQRLYQEVLRTFPDWMLYESLYSDPAFLVESLRLEHMEHRAIVEAISSHDPGAALKRSTEHIFRRGCELHTHLGIPRAELDARERHIRQLIPETEINVTMDVEENT